MAKAGILHRDLTLDNILVKCEPGKPVSMKVCDFGVSGTAADYQQIPRGKMRNYPPEAMGTVGADYEYSEKSDLFMFGLIMWEMLHNKLVWNDVNTAMANKRVMAGEIPQVDEGVRERVPKEVIELMYECLEFEPAKRPSFSDVAEKLRGIYSKVK